MVSAGTPVWLKVYDLNGCWNAATHPRGLGLYRTGIELDGLEYTYNSHNGREEDNSSGDDADAAASEVVRRIVAWRSESMVVLGGER